MNDQPTMEITSPGGRGVAADVSGPGDGPAVVLFHSAPGSRRFDPDPAATAAAGVRLVTIDRAGYGRSEPFAGGMPSIPAYANDAAAVLDQLGIGEAVLAGWSAGGRIAAALAARRPALARALLVIATPAPDEEVPWLPDEQRPAIQTMREDPVAAVTQMVGLLEGTDPASVLATLRAARADADALEDPGFRERVEAMLSEAFIQGTVGLASDIVSFTVAPWGFDLVAIQAPTTCVYGEADEPVPPAHGAWWTGQIPDSELESVPGAGHLVIRQAWPLVLAAATGSPAEPGRTG
jgi:pimeloyl-ACP methyl ester carboxylesterase